MKRTKEEAAKTRRDLLDAALAEFSRNGYQLTRLQDIAAAAGTTRGAIYHHFQSKADLYRELLDEANTLGAQAVQGAIAAGGSLVDILRAILVKSIELATTEPRFKQALALSLYRTGVDPELADLLEQREEAGEAMVASIAGFMQAAMERGELRRDLSATTLSRAFLAYQNGLMWLWLAGGERFSIAAEAEALAEALLGGLAPR